MMMNMNMNMNMMMMMMMGDEHIRLMLKQRELVSYTLYYDDGYKYS